MDDVVIATESEVAHKAHGFRQLVIVSDNGTPFKCVERLGGVEAEHFARSKPTDRLPFVCASEGVGGIEHQFQPVLVGYGLQLVDGCGTTPNMHTDDAAGARRNHPANSIGVEVVRRGVDVGEHRRDALPVKCMRCGDKGPRRYDDFAFQSECADGNFKSDGAIAHGDAMFDAEVGGDALLEFLHHRATVRQPLVVQNLVDPFKKGCAVANIGSPHVERLIEGGRSAIDGEISFAANDLSWHDDEAF